ncbi:MAG: exodeoxyribonuclease VII large subunit [Candidatus Doudnabacteria bacterium]|nr:exodeoxyribonuclease VII large subunit [Candidatus Doudnabacteria bacterium]
MDFNLLNLLKEKRREIAGREGRELFRVFQNKTLEATVEAMPKGLRDLENIKGWGKKKIAMYGREILEVLNGTPVNDNSLFSFNSKSTTPAQTPAVKSATPKQPAGPRVLSVQELLAYLNDRFVQLGTLQVRGEITEISKRDNYCFFTIKDSQSQDHLVSCFMGRIAMNAYDYLLDEGMEVVISAVPSLYKTGRFSLTVSKIEAFGEGALKKAFEALKNKLQDKGFFDVERKRPMPEYINKIGLITSESGAAVRDFLKNLGNYGFQITLCDVRVEGDYAEESIINAIGKLNKARPDLDVLVLLRGGGSLENFKAFNSEGVAEAIVTSRLPILTGIGHERDISIADLAADLSLSTPTAVAAYIKNQRIGLIEHVGRIADDLAAAAENILSAQKEKLADAQMGLKNSYYEILHNQKVKLGRLAAQMQYGLDKVFNRFRELEKAFIHSFYHQRSLIQAHLHRTGQITRESCIILAKKLQFHKGRLDVAEAALMPLSPEAVLKKGYSIVYKSGKVLKNAADVQPGDMLNLKLYKGNILTSAEEINN